MHTDGGYTPGMLNDIERASVASSTRREDTTKEKDADIASIHNVPPAGGIYTEKVWLLRILDVEARGIVPTLAAERTDPEFWKIFFIWLSANCNILSYVLEHYHHP